MERPPRGGDETGLLAVGGPTTISATRSSGSRASGGGDERVRDRDRGENVAARASRGEPPGAARARPRRMRRTRMPRTPRRLGGGARLGTRSRARPGTRRRATAARVLRRQVREQRSPDGGARWRAIDAPEVPGDADACARYERRQTNVCGECSSRQAARPSHPQTPRAKLGWATRERARRALSPLDRKDVAPDLRRRDPAVSTAALGTSVRPSRSARRWTLGARPPPRPAAGARFRALCCRLPRAAAASRSARARAARGDPGNCVAPTRRRGRPTVWRDRRSRPPRRRVPCVCGESAAVRMRGARVRVERAGTNARPQFSSRSDRRPGCSSSAASPSDAAHPAPCSSTLSAAVSAQRIAAGRPPRRWRPRFALTKY